MIVTAVKGSLQLGINHLLTTRSCRGMIIGKMSFLVTPTAKGLALARTTALTAMNLLGAEYLTATRIVKGLAVTGMNALATTTLKGKAIARIGVLAATNNQDFYPLATTT
ncbi:hypothetical protein D6C86_04946 [Aureobasidium pullulans]|nr:hypothetical protein D6C86_04946 [Aureobasidium pullulans]THZ86330.1 hypothetical protein D6C88_05408 [Aureobasidium pullulans]